MSKSSLTGGLVRLLGLVLLPLRAPLLLLLFGISVYLGMHWSLTEPSSQLSRASWPDLFWSIDCLHAVLVVFICTMPELLLQRVSSLMAASRVISLVISLLIVTVGGLYLLHLNVLTNVLILGSGVLLARLDLVRLRLLPPPLLSALSFSVLVLFGSALGRYLAEVSMR